MPKGIAQFKNVGTIYLHQIDSKQLSIEFFIQHLQPYSTHAIHIHEWGDTTKGCTSLGGHYNPTHQMHGSLHSKHRHLGDLFNNFTTNSKGSFYTQFISSELNIFDLYGRSFVIHYHPDDYGVAQYEKKTNAELDTLCKNLGYEGLQTRQDMIYKLNKESKLSGNAGQRLDCAIIARCPDENI